MQQKKGTHDSGRGLTVRQSLARPWRCAIGACLLCSGSRARVSSCRVRRVGGRQEERGEGRGEEKSRSRQGRASDDGGCQQKALAAFGARKPAWPDLAIAG